MSDTILHFSHSGLPDSRIIKYANLQSKMGHKVFFCGRFVKKELLDSNDSPFSGHYQLPASRITMLGINPAFNKFKKGFKKILSDLNPDIIHAHDILASKVCSDLREPFIYDDHEYWSKQARIRPYSSLSRILTNPLMIIRYSSWERKVLDTARVVITVSDTIKEDHERKTQTPVFCVPNFVSELDHKILSNLKQSKKRLSVVVFGGKRTKEDLKALIDVCDSLEPEKYFITVIGKEPLVNDRINCVGYLSFKELFLELPKHHTGLIPIPKKRERKNYIKYSSPNRIFQMISAGVTPLINTRQTYLTELLGSYCFVYNDMDDIVGYLDALKDDFDFIQNQPKIINKYASRLTFENLMHIIDEAYKKFKM